MNKHEHSRRAFLSSFAKGPLPLSRSVSLVLASWKLLKRCRWCLDTNWSSNRQTSLCWRRPAPDGLLRRGIGRRRAGRRSFARRRDIADVAGAGFAGGIAAAAGAVGAGSRASRKN